MVNLFQEIIVAAIQYNALIDGEKEELIIIDKGESEVFDLNNKEDFDKLKNKYDYEYDDSFGHVQITDLQIIIDDSTWLERYSYDGLEGFVLKAHPINSKYKTEEVHMG